MATATNCINYSLLRFLLDRTDLSALATNNTDGNTNTSPSTSNITSPTAGGAGAITPSQPPPPHRPSKTFTIDIPMSADDDVTESFDALRLQHESSINDLVPFISSEEDEAMDYDWLNSNSNNNTDAQSSSSVISSHASSLPVGASALSTPPSSATNVPRRQKNRMVASLGLQPQFNLDSAGKLLSTFTQVMLNRFHCVALNVDGEKKDSVASLAQERPFVLLAALAAASGSRTLQGHSLYDEEFRKILGLKYVAGGERNLELLQGLVVYIAWYPFHLRPKNKQALQYIRMAVDIVVDLELDQDPETDSLDVQPPLYRLDQIRTYMATYYLASSFACTWGRTPSLTYTSYTAQCCDMLERHSPIKGDQILAWKVRLQRLIEETNDLRRTNRGHSQSEYQINLMIRGMENQLAEWEERMSPEYIHLPTIRLSILFTRLFLSGAPLLKLPSVKLPTLDASSTFRADPNRLLSSVPTLHASYEYFLSLSGEEINAFTGVEWSGFILSVILGFRMSFPMVVCPEWDHTTARELLKFDEYMGRMCRMGGKVDEEKQQPELKGRRKSSLGTAGGGAEKSTGQVSMDVLSASRVILGVVRKKFLKRVAKVEGGSLGSPYSAAQMQQHRQQQHPVFQVPVSVPMPAVPTVATGGGQVQHDSSTAGCPMMDGSLEAYYPIWDETYASGLNMPGGHPHAHPHTTGPAHSAGVVVPVVAGGGDMDVEGGQQQVPVTMHEQQQQQVVYNDLWAAMTMGWATQAGGYGGM
ncbi:hypothetical protein QBC43DRAFT_334721 [Cladorrhinum sp. PSN259]|nr:hypothetical protein QBC43DRAFT_334721 [Cladorrhinum sp. PSN259]